MHFEKKEKKQMNVIKRNHGQRKKIKYMQEVQKRQMTYELYRMGKDLR